MKLTLLTLASILLPSTLALTIPPYPINATTNGTITPPSRYYLQTRVKDYGNEDKDGLYVSAYHTGAGENDATLEASIGEAAVGYLNGSNQQFDLGTTFPWGFNLVDVDFYAEWDLVAINAGYGSPGFFFNESGLQGDDDLGDFGGWLACEWWHGVPQLFWKVAYEPTDLPSSCSEVDLLPVAVL